MPLPSSIIPGKRRVRRKRRQGAAAAPPVALTLVSATFDPDGDILYLTFDRAVDVSGVDFTAFEVKDGDNSSDFVGSGAAGQNDPTQCNVPMQSAGSYSGSGVVAMVGSANGIVAVDDGGTWDGVSGLVLPWP